MTENTYIVRVEDNNKVKLNHIDAKEPIFNDCWNKIGVMGDRSCGELKKVIHCYECSVYASVGDSLLEREPPADYLEDWRKIIIQGETSVGDHIANTKGTVVHLTQAISIVIFSLGNEILAMPVHMLQEITYPCVIQTLPHRSNELFLGLVNIRGEILLCVSLHNLLDIQLHQDNPQGLINSKDNSTVKPVNAQRMIVFGEGENKWVFPVDMVHGIFRFQLNELHDTPVVITKSEESYTKGIIYWEGKKVKYLDCELLVYTLTQKIT